MAKMKVAQYLKNTELAIDFGYWYGTYGQLATRALWGSKSAQYPKWYNDPDHKDELARWLGKKVLDCIGLDKFARWLQSNGEVKYRADGGPDLSADGTYNYAIELGMESGPISTMPDVPGVCLRKPGHFGIYVGKGISRESRGGNWGVEDYDYKTRGWTHWFYNPFLDYEVEIIKEYKVTCNSLNVRSGAGTTFPSIAVVHNGDILQVTEMMGMWGKHKLGWSHVGTAYCQPVGVTPPPSPVEDYSKWPVLRYGNKGEYVKRMQTNLILKGYSIPAGATGNYLDQTAAAVLDFLKDVGLISQNTTSVKNIAWGQRCWRALLS